MKRLTLITTDANEPEEIGSYLHCRKCLDEWKALRDGTSPREYARVQVGTHAEGIQVVCTRHDCNIAVIGVAR